LQHNFYRTIDIKELCLYDNNEIYKIRINSANKYSTVALKKMRFCLISNKHNGGTIQYLKMSDLSIYAGGKQFKRIEKVNVTGIEKSDY